MRRGAVWIGIVLAGVLAREGGAGEVDGARLYQRRCAACHGAAGRGDGPDAALYDPRPRDLRTGFLARYPVDDLVRRVRDGTPLALALDLPALRARAKDVEAIATHLARLPAIDWRLADAGHEIFIDHCELCHGPFGRGSDVLPPGVSRPRDLADPAYQAAVDDRTLAVVVRHGRKGMPVLTPRLAETDVAPLVAFVRLLSPGYAQYSRSCAACHGDDGHGAGSFAEAVPAPTVVFDRRYFATRDPEILRSSIWHMAAEKTPVMPHLRARLSEAEARAIVAYLKALD